MEGRVLGIDFGAKRIGLAVSDPSNTLATPLPTLVRRQGRRAPLSKIGDIAVQHDVGRLIVGLPLSPSGEESPWCAEVRELGDALAQRLDVEVTYVDERMTSVRAQQAVRAVGLPRSKRREKTRVDAAAAQLILQAWLDNPTIAR